MAEGPAGSCPSCGSVRMGAFCPDCGERRPDPEALRLSRLFAAFVGAALDLDGRFWVTLRTIALQPGRVTGDVIAGRRRPWLGLVQLFLFCNLAYFLLQPFTGINTLATSYESHLGDQLYSEWARSLVDGHLARSGEDAANFRGRMSAQLDTISRALVVVLVPLFAALLAAVTLPRRPAFGAQLLLATEFLAFQLLFVFLAVGLAQRVLFLELGLLRAIGSAGSTELILTLTIAVPILAWLALALRRVHGFTTGAAILRAVVMTGLVTLPIILFRAVVFLLAYALA